MLKITLMSEEYHLPVMRKKMTRYADTKKDKFRFEDRFQDPFAAKTIK